MVQAIQLSLTFEGPLFLATPDELYESLSGELLPRLKEDRRIERKPRGIHPRSLGEYFSMWANTAPDGGIIVLGIEDDGTLSGCKELSQEALNERELTGRNFCPDSRSESRIVPVVNDRGEQDFVLAQRSNVIQRLALSLKRSPRSCRASAVPVRGWQPWP